MDEREKKVYVMISPNFPDNYYKFAKELKNRGLVVLGIGDAFPTEIKPILRDNLTEYVQCYNMKDVSQMIQIIQNFKNKYGRIDFIESNNEYWLEEDSTLREWFNIPNGLFHRDIMKYKAKSLMKEYFIKAGAKVAKWHISDTFAETESWAAVVGYPIFVKPNIGVGAVGTRKIKNIQDLQDFYNTYDHKEYIFEEYIEGETLSFDGITNAKGEIIFENGEDFMVDNEKIVNGGSDDAYYTFKELPADLKELGEKVVKAFDIRQRCFHIEFFRLYEDSKLGKKGDLFALEVNLRPAGGSTPDLISLSQNVNMYAIFADMITTDQNFQDLSKPKCFAISAARKNVFSYFHTEFEILNKYKENIKQYGTYPKEIADDMGDSYFIAGFETLEEAIEFEQFVRLKNANNVIL